MALTNDQITAQNFKDFYNHIMPYLNGQPALNYSTDEQVVGTWIDGKPLYQKTFSISETQLTAGQWTVLNSIDCSALNMNELLGAQFFNISSGNSIVRSYVSGAYMPGTTIYLRAFSPISKDVEINTVTIRYTKTTD